MFADIAFPISSFQIFTYKVPEEFEDKITIGCRVKAPFKTKEIFGIVVELKNNTIYNKKIKSIIFVDEFSVLTKELWILANWISDYYHTPIGKVVKTMIPFSLSSNYSPKFALYVIIKKNITYTKLKNLKLKAPRQFELFYFLYKKKVPIAISKIKDFFPYALSLCRALEKKNIVKIFKDKLDLKNQIFKPIFKSIQFNSEQEIANNQIKNSMSSKLFSPYLLHGVTGSGKTEIYINAVKQCISQNRTAIILLPEISLTPQIAGRFKSVFGNIIAIWHSKLTKKQKWLTWNKIYKKKCKIVIGARSAVFSPLKNIGLIVVDEEQDSSFRQEDPSPRYNARDVSLIRGKITKAVVLLSSATPSIDTYYNYLKNKIKYIRLSKRFGKSKYPKIHLVNMNDEQSETGKFGITISNLMQNKIEERLDKKEQIILLQNRRGYSPIIRCLECEKTLSCPFCRIALSYHKDIFKIICHSCGYSNKKIKKCIYCYSRSIKYLGVGTQKIESIINQIFPKAKYVRLDTDISQNYNILINNLKLFSEGKIDILIGTQMIAKGLDFPNATLVGVINADIGLNIPDFRSEERIFQLLYQASGRAGRRNKQGEVVIQTFVPENPAIKYSVNLKLKKYYNIILNERKELNYPPYSWITKIEFSGIDMNYVSDVSKKVKTNLKGYYKGLDILGPAPCYYEKIRNKYRYQLIFKSLKRFDPNSKKLQKFLKINFINKKYKINYNKCKISIHKDPLSLV